MSNVPLRRPKGKRVPHGDAVVSVTLAFAPFETVFPVTVGVFRAAYGHSLLEDVHERKEPYMLRLREEEQQPNVIHLEAGTILEPKDAPNLTVIEDWCGPDRAALAHFLPETQFLSIFSLWEKATVEQHAYTLRQGTNVVRHVSLDRNMTKSGWTWEEEGDVQPWEDSERLTARALSKRCDRPLLFRYAEALGCDLQAVLGSPRRARQAKLVRAISHWDTTPDLSPTMVGESIRKAAITAGFGGTDTYENFEEQKRVAHEAQEEFADEIDALAQINRSRSAKGLTRIMTETAPRPGPRSALKRVSNWRHAVRHAFRKFPDDPNLKELTTRATSETEGDDYAITANELDRLAAECLETEDMAAHVRAYRQIIASATRPLELAEASLLYAGGRGTRFQPQFRVNALYELLEAALKLDPLDHGTEGIVRLHDRAQRDAGQIMPGQTGDGRRRLEEAQRGKP